VSTPVIVHGDFNAAALKNAYRVVMRVLFISGELIAGDLPYRLSE
jgi:endonuclease/exonuclease/phosphatase family metal-dependent hydrolase